MIRCTFYRDSHDNLGIQVITTWQRLVERLSRHEVGNKDGPALACATFNGLRRNANIVERSMVALDIEASQRTGEVPIPFAAMADHLAVRRVQAMIWTTHSHAPDMPRYRVLMPLSEPLPYESLTDVHLSACAAAQLRCHGVCDPSKFGAASLFFLPRHRDGAEHEVRVIAGEPIDAGMLLTYATTVAERVERDEAETAALRRANALPDDVRFTIENYNALHPLVDALSRYGYVREGNRWRSRYQHGQGATVILDVGRWASFSASDADAGVGNKPLRSSSQCACWGDAFSLFVHYEHGGNFRRALAALTPMEAANATSH